MEVPMTTKGVNEIPEDRFKRVAETRTNAILDKLRLLGNCANSRIYTYTEKDVDRIFSVINKQIKEIRLKFNTNKYKHKKFTLSETSK